MRILVTAGNTMTLIDKVRAITNIFTGRTGASIALEAHRRGHAVTLLTSHPEAVEKSNRENQQLGDRWTLRRYQTFEDLQDRMKDLLTSGAFEVLVHCAAVSDYRSAGIFAPEEGTSFDPEHGAWKASTGEPRMKDRAAGKVKSDEDELWLRLIRTPKLVDLVRAEWGFSGILVKFKLEVGIDDRRLLEIAERSRAHSQADLMVANTLEGAPHYAFLGPLQGEYQRVARRDLASRLLEVLEARSGDDG